MRRQFPSKAKSRRKASIQARRWLEQVIVLTGELGALRKLGLSLCEQICTDSGRATTTGSKSVRLPKPATFIGMSRSKILALARAISLSNPKAWRMEDVDRRLWAQVFGGIALSYARVGDLSAVAVLVRAAAHLGLSDPWLTEAETYMLDQQRPDGCFGLIMPELALLQNDILVSDLLLRLTVEVLWALAEAENRDRFS